VRGEEGRGGERRGEEGRGGERRGEDVFVSRYNRDNNQCSGGDDVSTLKSKAG
jgi:hypothetical protein